MPVAALLLLPLLLAPAVLAEPSSIILQLQASGYTGFVKLLEHADVIPDVEAALNSGKALTLFCPTDEALMHHTSPTLLAFLKLQENKAALRQLLLSHIVTERLSPFQWEGHHPTMHGTPLKLTMDASAFYAHNVPVTQYNALVSGEASVHSLPTLIVPSSLAEGAKSMVAQATEMRRVLKAADAPAPASFKGPYENPPTMGPQQINASPANALASLCSVAFAAVAAALFL